MILRPSRYQYSEKNPSISFKDFCNKSVKKYDKWKLLLLTGGVIWRHFHNTFYGRDREKAIIIRSFSVKVFSLILANGSSSKLNPEETNVYELNNEIFHFSNPITDKNFSNAEKDELFRLFQQGNNPLYKITKDEVNFLHFNINLTRMLKAQHNTEFGGDLNECIRAREIFRHFVTCIRGKVDVEPLIKNLFGMSEDDFLKTAILVYTALFANNEQSIFKCVLKVSQIPWSKENEKKSNITREMFHLCILRLLGDSVEYKDWLKRIELAHEYYAANSISPLFRKPIISVNSIIDGFDPDNESYIVPSAKLLFRGISKTFYLTAKENEKLFEKRLSRERSPEERDKKIIDIDIFYGEAIESYFENFMSRNIRGSKFRRIPRVENEKSADFLIETDKYEIYVELKKAMAGIEAINILRPDDAYSYYSRLMKSCEQLSASILRSNSDKIKIGIVCYEDCYGLDTAGFLNINLKNGTFDKMGLSNIDVFSFSMLEKLIMERNKENVIPKIIKNCEISKKSFNPHTFQPVDEESFRSKKYYRLYDKAYNSLWNGLLDE